jgi:predicted dehydrogenase
MEPLRVGIVGCGEVVQIVHLPSLYRLADKFRVTALCDVSRTVLDGVGDHWTVAKRYQDYQELVEQADVDVVLIANPHAYHAVVADAALAAGKHVMVEKPACLTLAQADALLTAQARAGRVVQVGYMRRYAPAFVAACQLVREMGDIRLARVHDVIGQNALIINATSRVIRGKDISSSVLAEGQALQNESVRAAIGDAPADLQNAYMLMLGLSSHDTSAMRELLGMPTRVLSATQRGGGYLTATFDYGAYVAVFETGADWLPRFDAHLEVYGAKKVVRVQYDTPYVLNLPIHLIVSEANGQGGLIEQHVHPAWGDPFVAEWEAFYDNVANGHTPKTSLADYRQDLVLFKDMIARMRETS